jgi:hypothetical protein
MRKQSLIVTMLVVLVLGLSAIAVGADDPFNGVWKLNVSKTTVKGDAGSAPKSRTFKFEPQKNGYRVVIDTIDTAGNASHREVLLILDGEQHPITDVPTLDARVARRIDSNTISSVSKKNGKDVERDVFAVSKDGKTLTITIERKNAKGEDVVLNVVYDKQ